MCAGQLIEIGSFNSISTPMTDGVLKEYDPDSSLVLQAIQGDLVAFDVLVKKHTQPLPSGSSFYRGFPPGRTPFRATFVGTSSARRARHQFQSLEDCTNCSCGSPHRFGGSRHPLNQAYSKNLAASIKLSLAVEPNFLQYAPMSLAWLPLPTRQGMVQRISHFIAPQSSTSCNVLEIRFAPKGPG